MPIFGDTKRILTINNKKAIGKMISTDCVVHKLMVKTAKDLCGHTLVHVEEEKGLGVIVDSHSQLNLRHTLMPRWPKL